MLVLSRRENEKIRIGSDIIVKIVTISENQVKLGIEAPPEVKVMREEVYQKLKEQIVEASQKIALGEIPDISKMNVNKIKTDSSDKDQQKN
ncbi:MAG: carbon storage regulator CsrA [Ignavibacteria bacterium]|nr:carbon storage regulator CsrA [Ignavibacteria bacterium]